MSVAEESSRTVSLRVSPLLRSSLVSLPNPGAMSFRLKLWTGKTHERLGSNNPILWGRANPKYLPVHEGQATGTALAHAVVEVGRRHQTRATVDDSQHGPRLCHLWAGTSNLQGPGHPAPQVKPLPRQNHTPAFSCLEDSISWTTGKI